MKHKLFKRELSKGFSLFSFIPFPLLQIVYGGPDRTSPNITHLCHRSTEPAVVSSTGNEMFVRFYSDVTIRGRGFFARYTAKTGGKKTAVSRA